MATAKKIVKKTVKKIVKKPTVELLSYAIKMTIPTGQYANIMPEIIVRAENPEEAHSYIVPHMNKLWKEYFMISERKIEVVKQPTAPKVEVKPAVVTDEASPVSDVALVKATQAIQSCTSVEALNLIINQVAKSVKLTPENKESLLPIIEEKTKKLNE